MAQDLTIYDPRKFARDQARVESGFWPKVRRVARRVPFLDEALAAYYCTLDPKTPIQAKAVLMAALAYFVMPVDVIPDFIAGFGFTDDATVLYAALRTVGRYIRDDHRAEAKQVLDRVLS
ncbi:MAG TPA: YkvA family protein [Candidatus Binatia bacterium]|nr:YkvA family protein [Candidatus Binatia bacterium]